MAPIVNSFQVPNALIDEYMEKMPDLSFKCYMFIARKTLGWQKSSDAISLSQFQKAGLAPTNRTNLLKALKYLEKNALILINREKNINTYELVLHKHQSGASQALVASASQAPTKDTITKDTITKESKAKLLDEAFTLFWSSYPRKDAKIQAQKSFKKLKTADREKLLLLLPAINENYKNTQKQHIPLPASFINGYRWEDEVYLLQKKSRRETGASADDGMERCVRRFRALSEGDEVLLHDVDVAVLGVLGMSEPEAVEMINVDGVGVFRSSVLSVWDEVNAGAVA